MSNRIAIKEGLVLECRTLTWDDGWEFECPCLMLAPVIRCWEQQMSHERMVESVMIDAVCQGWIKDENFQETWGWRGYKLPVLRRRFQEYMRGKRFPVAGYHAEVSTVMITKDKHGELTWVDTFPDTP